MKNILKVKSGFTVIEILTFLGLIAAICVAGMYFYGMIGSTGKVDDVLEKVRAINAAVINMQSAGGSSTNSLTIESIGAMLPSDGLITPWGTKIVLAGTSSDSFTINIPMMPAAICPKIMEKLSTNTRFDLSATKCPADLNSTVSFTYTYYTSVQ